MGNYMQVMQVVRGRTGSSKWMDDDASVIRVGLNRYGLVLGLVVVVSFFSILSPQNYFDLNNFRSIINSQIVLLLIAMAQLVPLVGGDLDFSIAANVGLSTVLMGQLVLVNSWPVWTAVIVALVSGVVVAGVNALLIVGVGVDSLIVTLGTFTLLSGGVLGINPSPIGGYMGSLAEVLTFRVGGLQLAFLVVLVITIGLWYWLKHLPSGRRLHFVGANREVARLSGINASRLRWTAFLMSGLLAGLGGVMMFGILGGSDPTLGPSMVFPAITAVILGSTAITPGVYNVGGTFTAVYLLVFGITGLELLGFTGWVPQVFFGGALILAVVSSKLTSGSVLAGKKLEKGQRERAAE